MISPSYSTYSNTVAGQSDLQSQGGPEDLAALLLRRGQLLAHFTEQAHEVESRRLEREQVRSLWLGRFGREFLAAEEACLRKLDAESALQLLEANPTMSRTELERVLFDRRAASEEQRQVLRLDLSRAAHPRLTPENSHYADEAEIARWTQESRTLTRKLWLALHPDLRRPETWARLTEEQRQKLEHILHGLDQPQHDELGLSPDFVFYDQPSPVALRRKLATVQTILAHAGIEIDDELLICGETEQEQIEFVRNDIALLERAIETARTELVRLLDDGDFRQWRTHLACREMHARIRQELTKAVERHTREAERLERLIHEKLGETE